MNQALKRWSREEIATLYHSPILELIHQGAGVLRQHHNSREIQVCTLLSIKTGACAEDCGYCSQSAHHKGTDIQPEKLIDPQVVLKNAKEAKEMGSDRFCMGAAWRQIRNNEDLEKITEMIRSVAKLDMEVCCTLGMITQDQAVRLKEAGLTAYNHNLDTSKNYYKNVVTTRTYEERLQTITHVQDAGISLCCGGIIGLGESAEDRIDMLHTLASFKTPPESVPVNALVPMPGTPLQDVKIVNVWEIVRMIATARIVMPLSRVRLSAGRERLSEVEQALCFLAGANSIFSGDKLLTAPNAGRNADESLFDLLNLNTKEIEEVE